MRERKRAGAQGEEALRQARDIITRRAICSFVTFASSVGGVMSHSERERAGGVGDRVLRNRVWRRGARGSGGVRPSQEARGRTSVVSVRRTAEVDVGAAYAGEDVRVRGFAALFRGVKSRVRRAKILLAFGWVR